MTVHPISGETYRIDPTTGIPNPNYRSPRVISRLKSRAEKSPDISELKFFKRIPLFVYGAVMSDGDDAHILKGAEYLGVAHTISPNFYMKANSYWPMAFPCPVDDPKKAHIRGEMYSVSPEHILMMDNYNSNGGSFFRIKSRFHLEEQENKAKILKSYKQEPFMEGFMYIGNSEYWKTTGSAKLYYRTRFTGSDKLKDKQFYVWKNRRDDENEEFGHTQMGFWRSEYNFNGH